MDKTSKVSITNVSWYFNISRRANNDPAGAIRLGRRRQVHDRREGHGRWKAATTFRRQGFCFDVVCNSAIARGHLLLLNFFAVLRGPLYSYGVLETLMSGHLTQC